MKNFNTHVITTLILFLLFCGCAGVSKEIIQEDEKPSDAAVYQVPETMAVLPFENNSVTEPEKYAPLSKGLSAMLTTDLKNSNTTLQIIEREKIQAILKEIALGQSGSVDQSTAVKAGKLLGAQSIVFGSFMVLGNNVRIDARIINVETGEVLMAEFITGDIGGFINIAVDLAAKIAKSMKVAFNPVKVKSTGNPDAAIYFSQGLDALDKGNKEEANRLFLNCIKLDPAYKVQVDNVKGLTK